MPSHLTYFQDLIQKTAVHNVDVNGKVKPFFVNSTTRDLFLKLEALNNQLVALTGGQFYMTKIAHTVQSLRRFASKQPRVGKVEWYRASANATRYLSDDVTELGEEFIAANKALFTDASTAQFNTVLAEISECLGKLQSKNDLQFTHMSAHNVPEEIRQVKAWILTHNIELKNTKSSKHSASVYEVGSTGEIRPVQALDGTFFLGKFIGYPDLKGLLALATNEINALSLLGRLFGIQFRNSETRKRNLNSYLRTFKAIIIMEHMGADLANTLMAGELYLNKNEPQADEKNLLLFLKLMVSVVEELFFLHQNGILHLDVKSENSGLIEKTWVRFFDFGHSAILKAGEQYKTLTGRMGSLGVRDPDIEAQFQRNRSVNYCKEHDLYAMGMLLVEMLPSDSVKCVWTSYETGTSNELCIPKYPKMCERFLSDSQYKEPLREIFDEALTLINQCYEPDFAQRGVLKDHVDNAKALFARADAILNPVFTAYPSYTHQEEALTVQVNPADNQFDLSAAHIDRLASQFTQTL